MGKDKEKNYQTLRIRPQTHRDLRLLAAMTGESMIDLIERLARQAREKAEARQRSNFLEGGTA